MWGSNDGDCKTMTDSKPPPDEAPAGKTPAGKKLRPEAARALEEAAARRAALDEKAKALAAKKELKGREGPDPVRYDDWEVKGLASDF
jgi:hypothetical protein